MAVSVTRLQTLKKLEEVIGYKFKNIVLLDKALSHKSFAKELRGLALEDNERLEFLGDAVLKLVVSEYLYQKFPKEDEGFLTKIRAGVVSDQSLATQANKNELGEYLQLSKNEAASGGKTRKSNVANALEAVFGATFLDGGMTAARAVVIKFLEPSIQEAAKLPDKNDHKSHLQERVQGLGWKLPEYRVIQEQGPEHEKTFVVQVKVGKGLKKFKEDGAGMTKKEAEQNAAEKVLKTIMDLGK